MKRRRGRPGVERHAVPRACVGILAGILVVAGRPSDASAGKLRTMVAQGAEATKEAAASQKKVDALSDEADALEREYRATIKTIEGLDAYNAQAERLVADQKQEIDDLGAQIEEIAVVARQLTPLMLSMLDALDRFVKLDVPFLLDERTKRVDDLRDMMDRADVTESEKYRRILEAYQIENEYGRTIEAYQGTLEAGGGARTVDFLRIGRVALLYQTLDGKETGVWDAQKGGWTVLPDEYRLSVRQGLRMARKQTAPDLITVPVPAPEVAR